MHADNEGARVARGRREGVGGAGRREGVREERGWGGNGGGGRAVEALEGEVRASGKGGRVGRGGGREGAREKRREGGGQGGGEGDGGDGFDRGEEKSRRAAGARRGLVAGGERWWGR